MPSIPSVGAVFIVELEEHRLHATLEHRSSSFRRLSEEQKGRVVAMNALYNHWIFERAQSDRQLWVPSQPWDTLADRIRAGLAGRRAPYAGCS
jgi:hypothetical protein